MILQGIIAGSHGSGGSPVFTLLTTTTVSELSGSNQNNVPFEVFVPLDGVAVIASSALGALDADGVTYIAVQEDNRTTDLNSKLRGVKVTGILPSLTANQNRQISIGYYTTTSPTTGTDITAAQITATGYDCVATCVNNDGVTYTASASAGLAAGTWTNKTTAANYGTWRSGGGLVTEYVVYVPYKNGAAPHPGGLFAVFCISAYKVGRGAVTGGNAVTAVKTQWWNENAFIQQSSPIECWYDLTVASGSNSVSWVGSTPPLTLTLSNNTLYNVVTASTASGTPFSLNSIGMMLADGTGYGVICGYNGPTSVNVLIFAIFSSTSISSGVWKTYGLNHPNSASTPPQTIWYSGLQQPKLTTYLGAVYDGVALTGGPGAYIRSAKVVRNYNTSASLVTNSTGNLDACGTNLMGYTSGQLGTGNAGDISMHMPDTGPNAIIADVPTIYVGALLKWDAAAPKVVFGNAGKGCMVTCKFRDSSTGKTVLMNNGTDYYVDCSSTGTPIARPTTLINNWDKDTNHWGQLFYASYLLSGDFCWAEMIQGTASYTWLQASSSTGSQLNRLATFAPQNLARGIAWTIQKIAETAFVTPDNSPAVLGWSQSHVRTWFSNQMSATNSGTAGVAPFPGGNISYTNNVGGAGKNYATSGPRWLGLDGGQGSLISMWLLGYLGISLFKIKRMGMASSDLLNFMSFVLEGLIYNATATTEIVPLYMVASYWMDQVYPVGTPLKTGPDIYAATAKDPNYAAKRQLNSTVTLSGTSGTITCTFPAGTFSNGGTAFYADGPIRDTGSGCARIISISGDTVTMTTVGSIPAHDLPSLACSPFSSATLTANNYYIPWPAVGDSLGTAWQPQPYSSYYEYWDIAQSLAVLYAADGYANGSAAKTFIDASYTGGNDLKWKCVP